MDRKILENIAERKWNMLKMENYLISRIVLCIGAAVLIAFIYLPAAYAQDFDPAKGDTVGDPIIVHEPDKHYMVLKGGVIGGGGGNAFRDDFHADSRVKAVIIWAGQYVSAVQMLHEDKQLPRHGGIGETKYIFELEQGEYIIGISGRAEGFVDSIIIHTNKRRSPKYGGKGGSSFSIMAPKGKEVVGFHGKSGALIDSIGILTK
jgi:hypothetical protein